MAQQQKQKQKQQQQKQQQQQQQESPPLNTTILGGARRHWSLDLLLALLSQSPDHTCVDFSYRDFGGEEKLLFKIFEYIKDRPISELKFRDCNLGDSELQAIAQGISQYQTLTSLYLDDNCFTHTGALEITKLIKGGLFPRLQKLNLYRKNNMDSSIVEEFIEAIMRSSTRNSIQTLIVSGCRLMDGGLLALANLISNSKSIHSLYFEWDPQVHQDTLVALFAAAKFNTSLKVFRTTNMAPLELIEDLFEHNSSIIETWNFPPIYTTVNRVSSKLKASDEIRKSVPIGLENEAAVEGFVNDLKQKSEEWNAMKVVLLGHGKIGKSALVNELKNSREEKPKQTFACFSSSPRKVKRAASGADDLVSSRTLGVDHSSIKIGNVEISIFDFAGQCEYTVTHHFFLSREMVLYLVCFDLSAPVDKQKEQIEYWLSFLNSSLPSSPSASIVPKWKVFVVGLRKDSRASSYVNSAMIPSWRAQWTNLPLHDELIEVSSHAQDGIQELLASIQRICNQIFHTHPTVIPPAYKKLLHSLQTIDEAESILTIDKLFEKHSQGMNMKHFVNALKYFHSTGHIIVMKDRLVCTAPKRILKLAAKYVSPRDVRDSLKVTSGVSLLEGDLTGVSVGLNEVKLRNELAVLEHASVCFKLTGPYSESMYVFPSLSPPSDSITFRSRGSSVDYQFSGIRFIHTKTNLIFVAGFFCQLVISIFIKLNLSMGEILRLHNDAVVVSCRGLFKGELLVKIEPDSKSIIFALKAHNSDLSFASSVFRKLVDRQFVQYSTCEEQFLCPFCVEMALSKSVFNSLDIGILDSRQFCTRRSHEGVIQSKPVPNTMSECKTHKETNHHFFLVYRVSSEGKKSPFFSAERQGGFIEMFYEKLATIKRANDPIFVFLDSKCLEHGQDRNYGLSNSKVIILFVSNKVIEDIATQSHIDQDNVLVQYECALLLNARFGTPVLTVLVGEITGDGLCEKFDVDKAKSVLPTTSHARGKDAQRVIDKLSETLPEEKREFLVSVAATLEKVFEQHTHLEKRGEDAAELDAFIKLAMDTLNNCNPVTPASNIPL